MAFTPFTESDQPTMSAFNQKFQDAIQEAASKDLVIESGTYKGTGKYGISNKNKIVFSSKPVVVFLFQVTDINDTGSKAYPAPFLNGQPDGIEVSGGDKVMLSWEENAVSWYHPSDAFLQFNGSGDTYGYKAICKGGDA